MVVFWELEAHTQGENMSPYPFCRLFVKAGMKGGHHANFWHDGVVDRHDLGGGELVQAWFLGPTASHGPDGGTTDHCEQTRHGFTKTHSKKRF